MPFIELVALLAVLQFMIFGMLVGVQRGASGLDAPKMTGHDGFERMNRVHMNTLECLVPFLPALFIAGAYWNTAFVALVGVVYLIGRVVYWRSYMVNPANRTIGFMLSFFPTVVLILLGLSGAVMAAFAG